MNRTLVQFAGGPFTLTASADRPDGAGQFPAVICCHGFTGNRIESRRLYVRLSMQLVSAGIGCFRFDHRGCGESEGDFSDFTAEGMLQDLDAAIAVFLKQDWVDRSRVAVVGYSLGGVSAAYLLHKWDRFKAAVMWSPVAEPNLIRTRLQERPEFQNAAERGYLDTGGFRVSADFYDKIGQLANPLEWARAYNEPMLFIHGANDDIVPPSSSEKYMEVRGNPGDVRIVVPNADHGFTTAKNGDRVVEDTVNWMRRTL